MLLISTKNCDLGNNKESRESTFKRFKNNQWLQVHGPLCWEFEAVYHIIPTSVYLHYICVYIIYVPTYILCMLISIADKNLKQLNPGIASKNQEP